MFGWQDDEQGGEESDGDIFSSTINPALAIHPDSMINDRCVSKRNGVYWWFI